MKSPKVVKLMKQNGKIITVNKPLIIVPQQTNKPTELSMQYPNVAQLKIAPSAANIKKPPMKSKPKIDKIVPRVIHSLPREVLSPPQDNVRKYFFHLFIFFQWFTFYYN